MEKRFISCMLAVCFFIVQFTTAFATEEAVWSETDNLEVYQEEMQEDTVSVLAEQEQDYVDGFIVKYKESNFLTSVKNALVGSSIEDSAAEAFDAALTEKNTQRQAILENAENIDEEPIQEYLSGENQVRETEILPYKEGYARIRLSEGVAPDIFMETILRDRSDIAYIQPDYKLELADTELEEPILQQPGQAELLEEGLPEEPVTEIPETTEAPAETAPPEELDLSSILYDRYTDIQAAWQTATGSGVKVAVIDSGIDITHSLLSGRIQDAWDIINHDVLTYSAENAVEYRHGTHVSGIIASTAPDASIIPIRVFQQGQAYTSDIIQAIEYAEEKGAKVVNCSWGATGDNPALREAMEASGMLFICAAGNNRMDLQHTPVYPACYGLDNTISVTALNDDLGLSYFSNYSLENVDIAAWGRDIESAWPDEAYEMMNGTSMAAAFITAGAAMAAELEVTDIKARIKDTADKLSNLESTVDEGNKISYYRLVNNLTEDGYAVVEPADDFDVHGYQRTPQEDWELFCSLDNIQVSGGSAHTLVLKSNGTVWSWGRNNYYQLGNGTNDDNGTPAQVPGLTDIIQIAATSDTNMALKADGTVYTWGRNTYGLLGNGSTSSTTCAVPQQIAGFNNVQQISTKSTHVLVLKQDGTVWGWGGNTYAQITGTDTTIYSPVQCEGLSDAAKTIAGANVSIVIRNNGQVYTWGRNTYGALGHGNTTALTTPTLVQDVTGVIDASSGESQIYLLKNNGTVWAAGYNAKGQLGLGDTTNRTSFTQVPGLSDIAEISSGKTHFIAVNKSGLVWTCGDNTYGQIGDGTITGYISSPYQVQGISAITHINAGDNFNFAITSDSMLWSWGDNEYCQLGDGSQLYYPAFTPIVTGNVKAASAGNNFSVILKTDGTVWVTGANDFGQLGNDTSVDYSSVFVQVSNLTDVEEISAGYGHVLARKSDGTVWAWGYNNSGQLGDGTTTNRFAPVQVQDTSGAYLTDIDQISAGYYHSLAIKDGAILAWGSNANGRFGNGNTTSSYRAITTNTLTGVIQVSAGTLHSAAVKSDGTAWTWGNNTYGQLGNGTTTASYSPVQVNGLSGVSMISAGRYHTVALKASETTGTVWTWGSNSYKQLGRTITGSSTSTPGQIPDITNARYVAAGYYRTLINRNNNAISGCGDSETLHTIGSTTYCSVNTLSIGYTHNILVTAQKTLFSNGWTDYGQLGDGRKFYASEPTLVVGQISDTQGDVMTDAHKIVANHTVTATLSGPTDTDWYVFQPKYSGVYTFSTTAYAVLYNADGSFVDGNSSLVNSRQVTLTYPNTYYLYLFDRGVAYNSTATYTLRVNGIAVKNNHKAYTTMVSSNEYYSNLSDGGKLYKGNQAVTQVINYPVSWLCASGNNLFYSAADAIFKFDGTTETKLIDSVKAYYLTTDGTNLYFANWSDGGKLYRCSVSGEGLTMVCKDVGTWLKAEGEYIYYNNSLDKGQRYRILKTSTNQSAGELVE